MKTMLNPILIFTIFLFLASCKNENNGDLEKNSSLEKEETVHSPFSEPHNLSEFKQTVFIPTLENKINLENNTVYSASLLYAWGEIRQTINSNLLIDPKFADLTLLNNSQFYLNVLKDDEYSIDVKIEGKTITAKAEFNKSLVFQPRLTEFHNKLKFNNQPVQSFGASYFDYPINQIIKVLYYENDENFILKLIPTEKDHEIILFKPNQNFSSISEMIQEVKRLSEIGQRQRTEDIHRWKYFLSDSDEDIVIIPKINFNIETDYQSLIGNIFIAKNIDFEIVKAWQRTAFNLDEGGAVVESEAEMAVDAAAEAIENTKPNPQNFIFDKPFLILLKRTDAQNPYFAFWVANGELMQKEQL